jgi:hypothetical protein
MLPQSADRDGLGSGGDTRIKPGSFRATSSSGVADKQQGNRARPAARTNLGNGADEQSDSQICRSDPANMDVLRLSMLLMSNSVLQTITLYS